MAYSGNFVYLCLIAGFYPNVMKTIVELNALLRKEMMLEWRRQSALGGVVLYLFSMVFLAYLAFDGRINTETWNALFWLILLFSAMNAIMKAFIQESERRHIFYYVMVSPATFINAKIIYNTGLLIGLAIAGFLVFTAFLGNPVQSFFLFFINLNAGMVGFSSILCLVSAIASRARNNFTLMAVLGFPLILPLLLVLIRVSGQTIYGTTFSAVAPGLITTLLLTAIAITLSNVLFPYIWKD